LTKAKKSGKTPDTIYFGDKEWEEIQSLTASGTTLKGVEFLKHVAPDFNFEHIEIDSYLGTETPSNNE
jgi:hypothetical protein